jgi:molecular chaperone DnaK (HSP70)
MAKTIVGIDLGTTYSCVAYIDQFGLVELNDQSNPATKKCRDLVVE